MNDKSRTKEKLIAELTQLRAQNTSLTKLIAGNISSEQAVEDARLYAESIVETVREPLLVLDADLKIISANRNFYRTFKVTPTESIGSFIYDLGNKQWDIPMLRQLLEDILPEKESFDDFEVDHNFQDIGHKIMLLNARCIYRKGIGRQLILLAIEDITEHKRLTDLVTESEERYRRLFETASDGIVLLEEIEGKITHTNLAAEKMFGYSKQECIGKKLSEIGVMLDMGDFSAVMQKLKKEGIINYMDVPVKSKTGLSIDTDIYLVDRALLVQCNIRDITERKRNDEALKDVLKQSEARYRSLFDSAHDAIILMDRNTIIDCNERTAELFRCPKERIIGNTTTSFWPERQPDGRLTSEVSLQHIKKALRHERSSNEVRHLRADGTLVDTDVTLNIFKVNGKKYLQAIIRDITERKKAEENLLKTLKELQESKDMLVQSEKLAAIGRLSAGVAHEILNPVNIISMRLQLLEEEEGISAMLEETIRVCQKQIDRIVKITKDISQFSRSSAERVEVCNLNSIVEQTLYLTAPRLNLEKITTEVHVSPDLPCIAIDKYRIEQVLLNLINNAIDAMEDRDKKVLYVSTQQIVSDEERRWARIMVSDTGKGISDGTISKIFDPFFTTKDMGKGTGLGLFICYGIIRDHQGTITARNNEQGGASFIIDLPQSLPATKQ